MIVEFDYSRLGRVESAQSSLVVTVNREEVLSNHGIDLINGEFGSLAICRDSRYVYQLYPMYRDGFSDRDEFYLDIDNGDRYCLVFKSVGEEFRTFQFFANRETGQWEEQPCPDQVD